MCVCGIFAIVTVLRGTHWVSCMRYIKTKTLNIIHLRSSLQLLQKVQVSGYFFLFCIPSEICNIEINTFGSGPFFNLAQILM